MLVRNLLGARFKETPKDCVIASHALMTKGGYMKYMSTGTYSLFAPTKSAVSRRYARVFVGGIGKIYEHRQRNGSLHRS